MVGSVLVATILVTEEDKKEPTNLALNQTYNYNYEINCGANNCPQTQLNFEKSRPTQTSIYILFGSMILCCLLSIAITFFFMDNISDTEEEKSNKTRTCSIIGKRFKTEIISLLKLYRNIDVWLLLPITVYNGFELTFIWFEFNRVHFSMLYLCLLL